MVLMRIRLIKCSFFGLPSNTAEYIQAYSRVGRKYVGIVMDVFRLVRERDRSYLKYFNLFHENKDLTIDPVPIDRWARNAIYYTLPGLFNALLLQYYEVQNGIAYNKIRNVRELLSSIVQTKLKIYYYNATAVILTVSRVSSMKK